LADHRRTSTRRRPLPSAPGADLGAEPVGLIFPPLLGEARNPSNANRDLKATLIRIDPSLEWVTSHTWRKTVVTRLDEAGLSARAIADHVGHAKPSMTQGVYIGRGVASAEAASALTRLAA
jgi:integrase